jgi:hypothetical protein
VADPVLRALLRDGDDDLWRRLRELLRERGIDPDATHVEQSFEDDDRHEFGLVVTRQGVPVRDRLLGGAAGGSAVRRVEAASRLAVRHSHG